MADAVTTPDGDADTNTDTNNQTRTGNGNEPAASGEGVSGEAQTEVDVLIVGAGLSGIGMAAHLGRECPWATYAVVEARDAIGGTWDLFTYPGIRSDSDMFTLGYDFKPWSSDVGIADGPSIKRYVLETALDYDVVRHIRFRRRVISAEWQSSRSRWTVIVEHLDGGEPTGERSTISCRWLQMCSGYYSYTDPHRPEFVGEERFTGRVVHPQFWPDDLHTDEQLSGRRVVVIGSGATAVTLVPSLAALGAHVTMLQRSPTWIAPLPNRSRLVVAVRRLLPDRVAYRAIRWFNASRSQFVYRMSRTRPERLKRLLNSAVDKELGGVLPRDPHFTPTYNPWDQRLCLAPDGDIFAAIRDGSATVVTDEIDTFDETGIVLRSGTHLDADIIVTATGLSLLALGGVTPLVDGQPIDIATTFTYKGCMYSGIPNLATTFGYINASWTLRADLIARYVCRLINHMRDIGAASATPLPNTDLVARPYIVDFPAGYMRRSMDEMPRQGERDPWTASQSYTADRKRLLGPDADLGEEMIFAPAADTESGTDAGHGPGADSDADAGDDAGSSRNVDDRSALSSRG